MIVDRKIPGKLQQIEGRYAALRFEKVADVPMALFETREHFRSEPQVEGWRPVEPGTPWGADWMNGWFQGDVTLSEACSVKRVFLRARPGGETLLFVDGREQGVFDPNHPVVLMAMNAEAGRSYHVALEAYAGHSLPGTQPADTGGRHPEASRVFGGVEVVLEREDVSAFVFDLKVLNQLAGVLDEPGLRRHRILAALTRVYALVDAMPEETGEASWRPKLAEAREIMRPLLELHNGPTTPWFGISGHSHIDTAWLWPLAETWRKCARTFSSALNLMEQYPEFRFVQSSPCQTDVVRREYPALFERIRERVAEGRWEPNGGMWVEPDCNIPSGESFVRQLLIGQAATREMFGYTADTLWMPDVFGYSAALPQILRLAGVEFFCTTKMAWNDTTRFPYDTFVWRGIDGTPVIAHFNSIHCWPDPEALTGQWRWVQHKDVQDRRFTAYGFGDGGGGPMAEMVEIARRVADLEGCPQARNLSVSEFMRGIRDELDLPEWSGELYLELHRGTLTSIAGIKRGNRKSEIALREAEFLCTLAALEGAPYPAAALRETWKTLLTNQFHDILPGSSIAEVNDEAIEELAGCVRQANALSAAALQTLAPPPAVPTRFLVINSLSWELWKQMELRGIPEGMHPTNGDIEAQWVEDVEGQRLLAVRGLPVPGLGAAILELEPGSPGGRSRFVVADDRNESSRAVLRFDANGRIVSLIEKASGREVVRPGGALNTFLLAEDVPAAWDNWDIDSDHALKRAPAGELVRRWVVADGPLQLRVRSEYRLGTASRITQDMVLHSDSARIDFDTVIDWAEKHTLLKVGFDLNVQAETARHEIQYGHVERPTHKNLPQDRARFEVCAHKWTDLSDGGFGVALLNDCKYGIGVEGSTLALSLLKSGTHPDARGDAGRHRVTYSLLPHGGSFNVMVVQAAYELNVPVTTAPAGPDCDGIDSLLQAAAHVVIVESVKWAESGEGVVVRLYEADRCDVRTPVRLHPRFRSASEVNLLEENRRPLPIEDGAVTLEFRPFEIKTLLLQ